MTTSLVVQIIFVLTVLLIWGMLVYQFVLCVAGYLYSREAAVERQQIDSKRVELPGISILIPAHNEEMVIEHTVDSLFSLDYPKDKLDVLIVNDASTDRTKEILDELALKYKGLRALNIPAGEGGKGKAAALNRALSMAKYPLIAIYDADNQPEHRALRYLATQFVMNPELGAALGKFRCLNRKRNLLTRFINIEGLSFQWIVQAGRWKLLKIATLPGTNFIIRKDVIQKLGGWDTEALTEDAELSLRILEAGYRIKFVPYAVTWEQEPENLKTWFKQRTRWARGNFYLLRKFLKNPKKGKSGAMASEMIYFLMLYYVFVGAITISAALFVLCLFGLLYIPVPGPYLEVWLLAYLLFVTEIVLMLSREPGEDSGENILCTMATYFTYCQLWPIVVARAFYLEYIKKEERKWDKTKRFKQERAAGGPA
ncbi:MAG: glycosyltransferase family 2 protein [Elusimicrobia bacterium]|nr:glycosyltransferase family 2 protein [Elusimicrobiota bacterium]